MIIGNWGEIVLYNNQLITNITGSFPFDFIEKPRLSGFPRLQKAGDKLGVVSLTMQLSTEYLVSSDPVDVYISLLNAAKISSRKSLSLGGLDLGLYVITSIRFNINQVEEIADGGLKIKDLTVSVEFKENPV